MQEPQDHQVWPWRIDQNWVYLSIQTHVQPDHPIILPIRAAQDWSSSGANPCIFFSISAWRQVRLVSRVLPEASEPDRQRHTVSLAVETDRGSQGLPKPAVDAAPSRRRPPSRPRCSRSARRPRCAAKRSSGGKTRRSCTAGSGPTHWSGWSVEVQNGPEHLPSKSRHV